MDYSSSASTSDPNIGQPTIDDMHISPSESSDQSSMESADESSMSSSDQPNMSFEGGNMSSSGAERYSPFMSE